MSAAIPQCGQLCRHVIRHCAEQQVRTTACTGITQHRWAGSPVTSDPLEGVSQPVPGVMMRLMTPPSSCRQAGRCLGTDDTKQPGEAAHCAAWFWAKSWRQRWASASIRQSINNIAAAHCQGHLPARSICRSHLLLDLHVCRAEVQIRTHWAEAFSTEAVER